MGDHPLLRRLKAIRCVSPTNRMPHPGYLCDVCAGSSDLRTAGSSLAGAFATLTANTTGQSHSAPMVSDTPVPP